MSNSPTHQSASSLMAVIIITMASLTVIGAMAILANVMMSSVFSWQQNVNALFAAESLADDVLLKLVRDPTTQIAQNYTLTVNGSDATATVYHSSQSGQPEMFEVRGTSGVYVRKIRVVYVNDNGKLQVISRQESK